MKVGVVARWRPVHVVHAALLEALCDRSSQAGGDGHVGPGELIIGLGSSNRYDARNPFTAEETRAMLEAVLAGRRGWRIVDVPDLGHGPRWAELVGGLFGPLDLFVTANPYVASLLGPRYALAHPRELIPPHRRAPVSGSVVRRAMARGEPWRHLVPPPVAALIDEARFRREFGLQTLADELAGPAERTPTLDEERASTLPR